MRVPLSVRAPVPPTVRFRKLMLLVTDRAELSEFKVTLGLPDVPKEAVPVPKAASFPITNVPPPRVNPPLKVFAPERVTVPVPTLVNPNDPPMAPLKVIAPAEVPTLEIAAKVTAPLRLAAPAPELTKAPALEIPVPLRLTASAPTVRPFRSKTAPELTVVPPAVDPSAESCPNFTVPALTVVVPPNELFPFKVSVLPEEL